MPKDGLRFLPHIVMEPSIVLKYFQVPSVGNSPYRGYTLVIWCPDYQGTGSSPFLRGTVSSGESRGGAGMEVPATSTKAKVLYKGGMDLYVLTRNSANRDKSPSGTCRTSPFVLCTYVCMCVCVCV